MARKVINIGTAVGAGNGDPARFALEKCNDNFEELYSIVSEDQNIEVPLNLTSDTSTEKLRLNGPSSSISGNSTDGVTNYGLLVFTPTQTQVRGASVGLFTNGTQRLSIDGSGSATFSVGVTSPSFVGPLVGNASTATTATNVNGGFVNATTGTFSGTVAANGNSIDSSALAFSAFQTPFTLNFGGGAQNLNIGVRSLSQTINIGSISEENSIYRFATGETKSGSAKSVAIGTGGVAGSSTNIAIGSSAGGSCTISSLILNANSISAVSVTAPTFNGDLNGNADTATDGVVTTGNYADPHWIASLNYSKLVGTVPTWNQNTTGNAATATRLQTARNINGVAFDGTAGISVNLNNQVTFNNGGAGGASGSAFNGGSALTVSYNTIGAPSVSGTGATGTWSISVTGNSGTSTALQTARNINGVPFNGSANISVNTNNSATFNAGGAGAAPGSTFNGGAPLTISYNTVGAPSTSGANATGTWAISVTGSAATATTATNQSGGTVSATTGAFSGNVTVAGSVESSVGTVSLFNNAMTTINFAGNSQNLNIGARLASQTIAIGGTSNTNSVYQFGTGPTQSGASKSVSIGTGGLSGSSTSVAIGSSAGGSCTISSPTTTVNQLTLSNATFPATQVASANPNTLDDYEEGTWLPTIAGSNTAGTVVYNTRVGSYTKIGRVVTLHCVASWTGGTGSGRLQITGIPFAASLGTAYIGCCRIIEGPTWDAGSTPTPGINPGFTIVEFDTHSSGGLTPGSVVYTAAGEVIFSITYEV